MAGDAEGADGADATGADARSDRSGPSRGQRRLLYYLFAVAALVFALGIAAVWVLTYGPLG